jgi:glycosyltransferase involved in cell wall biosynthesis
MFCSTIIATIGRNTLSRAVNSVLSQSFEYEGFEVILVNDSGKPLPGEDWHKFQQVSIIHTNRRERSVARNAGAAMARGRYLHFLDDDDWLLPNALKGFWDLSQTQTPAWMYGGTQLVDRNGNKLIQLHHEISGNCFLQAMAGEWIPLQSSLIDARLFHEIGGFNPLLTGPEDIDLLRRISLHGEVAELNRLVACIEMGNQGSTTNYITHPELSRWAREQILDFSGSFSRMRAGANSSFWYGKFTRIYLTSIIWGIQHKRLFTALSRFFNGMWGMTLSGRFALSRDFWRSLIQPYQSITFEKGIQEAREKLLA